MASLLFPKYKEVLLGAGVNLSSGTVKIVFLDLGQYTYSASHQFYSSIPAGARIGTPQTLGSKTLTSGVFDAADVTFTALTGVSVEALLVYVDTGVEATSPLVALIDTATGLPLTPSGQDEVVQFNASGIFAL